MAMCIVGRTLRMPFLLAALFTVGAISCTFKGVAPETLKAPSQKYQVIVIGDITVEDKLWDNLVPHFRTGLAKELARQKAFDAVLDTAPVPMPDSAVVFSGKITEVHKGSQALRFFIGMGTGQARVSGVFEISDTGGQPLARLTATESYLGGAGIGGADLLLPEDLMRRFGEYMADKTVKWSRGEKLE